MYWANLPPPAPNAWVNLIAFGVLGLAAIVTGFVCTFQVCDLIYCCLTLQLCRRWGRSRSRRPVPLPELSSKQAEKQASKSMYGEKRRLVADESS